MIITFFIKWGSKCSLGFPGGLVIKNLPANAEDMGPIPGLERSSGEKWLLTPVFSPGKFQGEGSLAGYSPWGHKESDVT